MQTAASESNKAPELPDSLEWVNTANPPTLAGAAGKISVLFFWTPSNANSLNLLPELRALENKHESGVVIIGIICPKFSRENSPQSALKAVNRHFVRYPVALDADYQLWQQYGIEGWPAAAVIDARGYLRRLLHGDDMEKSLDSAVSALLDEAASSEIRNYGRVDRARRSEPGAILQFPTCILHDRGHIYISDSGNNRVLEVNEQGRVIRVFGSGNPGFWDGALQNAGFNSPHGLSIAENYLYVADTGNHAIRRVNLFSGEIETIMGTGSPVKQSVRANTNLREIGLMSPTGMIGRGPDLFITMSSMHQVWRLDLKNMQVGWHSGSGQLGLVNGEPQHAAFACPQGITRDEKFLYVADADASAIRQVNIKTGEVQTKIGRGTFTFGYEDGGRGQALMQYPCGVGMSINREQLWVADTYNCKLRLVDLKTGQVSTPSIDFEFNEPTYITVFDHALWVADTCSHRILRVHLADRTVKPFDIVETGI